MPLHGRYGESPEPNEARRLLFKFLDQVLQDARARGEQVGRLEQKITALGRIFYVYSVDQWSIDIHPYYGIPREENTMRMRKGWFDWHEEDGRWFILNACRDDIISEFVEVLTK